LKLTTGGGEFELGHSCIV